MARKSAGRMAREAATIQAMIRLYCRRRHGGGDGLCPRCQELQSYALHRLAACPFQEGKTTCARCSIHCYKPLMRDRVRTVMRRIGPGMICYHPLMALRHFLDGLRKVPRKKR